MKKLFGVLTLALAAACAEPTAAPDGPRFSGSGTFDAEIVTRQAPQVGKYITFGAVLINASSTDRTQYHYSWTRNGQPIPFGSGYGVYQVSEYYSGAPLSIDVVVTGPDGTAYGDYIVEPSPLDSSRNQQRCTLGWTEFCP